LKQPQFHNQREKRGSKQIKQEIMFKIFFLSESLENSSSHEVEHQTICWWATLFKMLCCCWGRIRITAEHATGGEADVLHHVINTWRWCSLHL